MSMLFNVSDLMKKVFGKAVENDPSIDNSVHFLIIYKNNAQCNDQFDETVIIQKVPKISCKLCFNKSSGMYLDGNVSFIGETLNMNFEISLNYINSKFEVELLETLNASGITPLSTFWFTKKFHVFEASRIVRHQWDVQTLKGIGGHLFLYFRITKNYIWPLKLEIPKNEMPAQFASLYEDKLLTDFKIICENEEFLVHKVVFAARSPVFRAMFQNNMKESQENQMKINDCKPKIVEQIVRYIYTDKFDVDLLEEDEIQKFLMIADKYALEKLKILCMRRIAESVDSFNKALEVISVGDTYNVEGCKEAMLQFIKDNQHILLKR